MTEEEKAKQQNPAGENPTDEKETVSSAEYIEALQKMKENSVPKSEYESLKKENSQLITALANGEIVKKEKGHKERQEKIKSLKEELSTTDSSTEMSNLDYIKKTLALRKELMEDGQPDPFIPHGSKIIPTADDMEKAENVVSVLNQCIDKCDGDSELFTSLLQSRLVDPPELTLMLARNKRK